ncbi:3050_t:CDS:10 [Acaulospora colombiana]|uniref:3050_t:CDS:1 n=1 Tax=Acaulospora colombiana TaxID=27376 RepID=A0ACA9M5H0_9GLOM|nr:3050_t:CDS:10 [Acaulospora colombiana]
MENFKTPQTGFSEWTAGRVATSSQPKFTTQGSEPPLYTSKVDLTPPGKFERFLSLSCGRGWSACKGYLFNQAVAPLRRDKPPLSCRHHRSSATLIRGRMMSYYTIEMRRNVNVNGFVSSQSKGERLDKRASENAAACMKHVRERWISEKTCWDSSNELCWQNTRLPGGLVWLFSDKSTMSSNRHLKRAGAMPTPESTAQSKDRYLIHAVAVAIGITSEQAVQLLYWQPDLIMKMNTGLLPPKHVEVAHPLRSYGSKIPTPNSSSFYGHLTLPHQHEASSRLHLGHSFYSLLYTPLNETIVEPTSFAAKATVVSIAVLLATSSDWINASALKDLLRIVQFSIFPLIGTSKLFVNNSPWTSCGPKRRASWDERQLSQTRWSCTITIQGARISHIAAYLRPHRSESITDTELDNCRQSTATSHQHTSSRSSNFSTATSAEWAQAVRGLRSPPPHQQTTVAAPNPMPFSQNPRDMAIYQSLQGTWPASSTANHAVGSPYSAANSLRSVGDVPPMSPSGTSVHNSTRATSPGTSGAHTSYSAVPISWTGTSGRPGTSGNASIITNASSGRQSMEDNAAGLARVNERFEQRFMYIYNAVAGGVAVQFILTVEAAPMTSDDSVITLTFKAGGIERSLCGREYMRLTVDPRTLNFHVFSDAVWGISMEYQAGGVARLVFEQSYSTVPIDSSIPYSNHRLRVWIRGHDGAYQRLFKSDEFRIGSQLAFEPLIRGPGNVVFATRDPASPAVALHTSLLISEPKEQERPGLSRSMSIAESRAEAEYEERRMGFNVGIGDGAATGSGSNLPLSGDEPLPPSYNATLGVGM